MPRLISLFILLAGFIVLSGCSTVPYTQRSQLIMISSSEELALGNQAASEVFKNEKESHDPKYAGPVTEVGKRIAAAADQPSFNWEYHVVDNPKTANAFCLPGGKIFVYTGLFKYALNNDQLAVVIGHEAAHAIARHGAERVSMSMAAQLGQQLAVTAAGIGGGSEMAGVAATAFGLGANYGVLMPYNRTQESEADRIGLILMAKAGYDPHAATDFWRNMIKGKEESGSGSPPEFFSTHPADQTRINDIERFMPEAMGYYNKARR